MEEMALPSPISFSLMIAYSSQGEMIKAQVLLILLCKLIVRAQVRR
jgi:hypothetical protein